MKQKMLQKRIVAFLFALVFLIAAPGAVYAAEGMLYETKETTTVTDGVTYEKNTRLYNRGWLTYHVLTIDMQNPNVSLNVLQSIKEFGLKESILEMAKDSGAIAAVNADFFNAGNPQTSLGVTMKDGKTLVSNNYTNYHTNQYNTFMLDSNNVPIIDFVSTRYMSFSLVDGEAVVELDGKNKISAGIKKPIYYNAATTTQDLDKRYNGLYKIMVQYDTVVYISGAGETVHIPENGYVIVMNTASAKEILPKFMVGQRVAFNEGYRFIGYPNKSIGEIQFGVSGGGKIIENGRTVETGLIIEKDKRHPRTLLGVNKEKTKVIIMAVDGRSKNSIGATHYECAALLYEYGAYNAMHFDGGGSTTFVARQLGDTQLTLENVPSDGSQRAVANGLGIFSNAPPGSPAGIALELGSPFQDKILMASRSATVVAKVYDEYYNPVPTGNITYSVEGVTGNFEGNKFFPTSSGRGTITASYGEVMSQMNITVTNAPNALRITPAVATLAQGDKINLKVEMVNDEGFSIPISNTDVTFSQTGGAIDAYGTFTATSNGLAHVFASYNGLNGSAQFAIGNESFSLSSFEKGEPLRFSASNTQILGSATYTVQEKREGNQSIELRYKFVPSEKNTQTASVEFSDFPVIIPDKVAGISLWLKGDNARCSLKSTLIDAHNNVYSITLAQDINFDSWKYVNAALPSECVYPVKIQNFYISAEGTGENTTEHSIFIDHLAYYRTAVVDSSFAREAGFVDPQRQNLFTPPLEDEMDVAIFGQTVSPKTPKEVEIFNKAKLIMGQNASLAIFAGYTDFANASISHVLTLQWRDSYHIDQNSYARIIHLATSKGGLKQTDGSQWQKIEKDLYGTERNNIILVMNKNAFRFNDPKEAELFHNMLKKFKNETQKNVIVVQATSDLSNVYVKDGIRYITLNGLTSNNNNDYAVLKIRASRNSLYYDFLPVE